MSIHEYTNRPEAAREEAIKLFITAIQVAPETISKELSGDKYADFLISGAKKIIEYIDIHSTKKT